MKRDFTTQEKIDYYTDKLLKAQWQVLFAQRRLVQLKRELREKRARKAR